MTATIHRVLMTLGSIFGGLGGVVALPESGVIGIPPEVGAATAVIAAVLILAANSIRSQWPTS